MPLAETGQPLRRLRGRAALGIDALLQERSQEPRKAGIPARRLDPGPLSHVFFQGYGYVA